MKSQATIDAKHLFAQPAYRRRLLRIWVQTGISTPAFGADQPLQYREGQRSLGLEILREDAAALGLPVDRLIATILTSEDQPPEETLNDDRRPESES